MAERAAPVQLGARQTVYAHEEMRTQEGVQLSNCGGSPVVRRCCIGVLRELLHEAARQEALEQLEWGAVGRQAVLLVAESRQRNSDGVQVARPLSFLLLCSGAFLLLLLLVAAAAAAGCLRVAASAALLLVAVPAVLQRQSQRSSHITLLEQREGRGGLLLCERQRLL